MIGLRRTLRVGVADRIRDVRDFDDGPVWRDATRRNSPREAKGSFARMRIGRSCIQLSLWLPVGPAAVGAFSP